PGSGNGGAGPFVRGDVREHLVQAVRVEVVVGARLQVLRVADASVRLDGRAAPGLERRGRGPARAAVRGRAVESVLAAELVPELVRDHGDVVIVGNGRRRPAGAGPPDLGTAGHTQTRHAADAPRD